MSSLVLAWYLSWESICCITIVGPPPSWYFQRFPESSTWAPWFTQHHPKLNLQKCRPIAFLATLMFAQLPRATWLLSCDAWWLFLREVCAEACVFSHWIVGFRRGEWEENHVAHLGILGSSANEGSTPTHCASTLLDSQINLFLDPRHLYISKSYLLQFMF